MHQWLVIIGAVTVLNSIAIYLIKRDADWMRASVAKLLTGIIDSLSAARDRAEEAATKSEPSPFVAEKIAQSPRVD